jgi:hypothetical protein
MKTRYKIVLCAIVADTLKFSLVRWPLLLIQVLCADWWRGDSVISGGADSKLCISSEIPVL